MTSKITDKAWEKAEVVYQDKSFIFFHTDGVDHIFSKLRNTGKFYEIELLDQLGALVQPGDWVVDVGANIGNHAIYFAGVCGCNVIAFEPNPVAAEILKKNIAANGLTDLINLHEAALGAASGSGVIVTATDHNLGMASVSMTDGDVGSVQINKLSDYVDSCNVRLLKIDAEGMDYDVLLGAEQVLSRDGCAVSIEAADRESYLRVARLMERYGYISTGSYNDTPTHIFLHVREINTQAFQLQTAREAALSYIAQIHVRDAVHRNSHETSDRFRQLSSSVERGTEIAKGSADLIATTLRELDGNVQRSNLERRNENKRLSNTLDETEIKISSQMTKILESLQQFGEKSLARHEANIRSTESLSEALSKQNSDLGILLQYSMMSAEIESLCDAIDSQAQKLKSHAMVSSSALKGIGAPAIHSARKRRAGVATTSGRVTMLEQAVMTIAPQVDEIHVFLNGHDTVPSFLNGIGTVFTYLSRDYDDLGDAGKFYALSHRQDGYYFSFDDDILYPHDYADRLIESVDKYHCPVGVHGSMIRRDLASYYTHQGRYVFHFRDKLAYDIPVDILGTGTFCTDLERHPIAINFDYRNMADLWVAEHYRKKQVPLISLARDYNWLRPIEANTPSIWDVNQAGESIQSIIVEEKSRALTEGPRPKLSAMPRIFIGIKTYNRKEYIQQSVESVIRTLEPGYDYVLAIADDGSEDGTLEYLEKLRLPIDLRVIRNKRRYASGQFNELVRYGLESGCEYFFLLDDDVVFRKTGWISAYRDASLQSGYDHLCHYNLPHHAQLAPRRGNDPIPTELKSNCYPLSAYGTVEQCMGALITLTPRVIEKVGFADETNFFVRGQWHVDFSARACRAGFNEYNRFFDLRNSNDYIELQNTIAQEYKTSIEWGSEEFKRAATAEEVTRRKAIVRMNNRIYSPAIPDFLPHEATALPSLHINEAFDRVLVMNLDRRPDRMATISERMKRAGIGFERFSAVDGQNSAVQEAYQAYAAGVTDFSRSIIKYSQQFYQGGFSASEQARFLQAKSGKPAIQSPGAWAYLLGYRAILRRALEEGWESFIVLDDDCVFHRDFTTLFDSAYRELPSDWRILHLGIMQYGWEFTERYSEHLYMPHGFIVASHAVAYRRAAIPGLLNWIEMMKLPYDVGPLQKESFIHRDKTFVASPNLAIQDDLLSDINTSSHDPQHVRMQNNKYRWNLNDYDY